MWSGGVEHKHKYKDRCNPGQLERLGDGVEASTRVAAGFPLFIITIWYFPKDISSSTVTAISSWFQGKIKESARVGLGEGTTMQWVEPNVGAMGRPRWKKWFVPIMIVPSYYLTCAWIFDFVITRGGWGRRWRTKQFGLCIWLKSHHVFAFLGFLQGK